MSKLNFKTVSLNCLFTVLCVAFYGCQPIDWPAVLPEKEGSSPAKVRRVVKYTYESINETRVIVDENSPASSQKATPVPPASEADLLIAHEQFYAAKNSLAAGDVGPMENTWSHAPDATYVDLAGNMKVGWAGIQGALNQEAANKAAEEVAAENLVINIKGEVAYTGCIEQIKQESGPNKERQATNVYRNEGGKWKLIHHHSKPIITLGRSDEPNEIPQQTEPNATPEVKQI